MNNLSKESDAPVIFKAGSVIFAEGKSSKYLYLVKKGEVKLIQFKGQGLTGVQLCGERDILNEVAILTNKPNELTAVAITDVELVLVDQKDVLSVINNSPLWIPKIFETLCERLKLTRDMVEEHNLSADKDPRLLINKEDEKKYVEALADFNGQT